MENPIAIHDPRKLRAIYAGDGAHPNITRSILELFGRSVINMTIDTVFICII